MTDQFSITPIGTFMAYQLDRTQSGYKFVPEQPADGLGLSLLYLDEPAWLPDNTATLCHRCGKNFNIRRRRHHCRRCGQIFCGRCTGFSIPLRRMYFVDPVRQCQACADISKTEVSFFVDKLRLLSTGANFEGLLPAANTPTQMGARQLFAYFSDCNRFLIVEQKDVTGLGRKLEVKIALSDITAAKFITNIRMRGVNQHQFVCGVQFSFRNPSDRSSTNNAISMNPSRHYGSDVGELACDWLGAFRQALQFVSERLSIQNKSINITHAPAPNNP